MFKELIHSSSGILMTVCYLLCTVPQIVKTIRTKSAKDISIGTLGLTICGHIFAAVYGTFGNNNFWTFVCYIGGLLSSGTMIYLWNKYGRD